MATEPPALPPLASAETSRALSDLLQAKFAEPAASAPASPESLAEPILESDDYGSFDPPQWNVAPQASVTLQSGVTTSAMHSPEHVTRPAAAIPAAPTFDLRSAIDVDSILAIRDAMSSLLGQLPSWELPSAKAPESQPKETPRVRVESSHDRIAMAIPYAATPTLIAARESDAVAAAPTGADRESTPYAPQETVLLQEPTPVPPPIPAPPQENRSERTADARPTAEAELAAEKPTPLLRYRPDALIAPLKEVAPGESQAAWASRALAQIELLTGSPADDPQDALQAIAELSNLATEANNRAASTVDPHDQSRWLRLGQAVARRLTIWEYLADEENRGVWRPSIEPPDRDAILRNLGEIAAIISDAAEGAEWREYLMIDELSALASVGADGQTERRRQAAREFFDRITSPLLTDAQRQFVTIPPIESLRWHVTPWASGAVNLSALSGLIDRFEATGSSRYGDLIHEQIIRMRWSGRADFERLAQDLSRDYRGANMRVALSGDLFNRMLPQQETVVAPVRERVAGSDVRGRSQTSTQLRVRLLPDPSVLRFGLEAAGNVRSQTYSDTWPAKVRNVGQMQYEARKLIIVNRHGLHAWPADADAFGANRLVGVESQLDPVPIVGSIVQSIARQQHQERRSLAMRQVRSRVVQQAQSKMDREADAKLQQLEDRFDAAVLRPLETLALAAEPLDMYTTEQRAVLRLRMANALQMGAHTPRPSAPSDSLASLQLHESALNNAARGLELEGRKMGAGQLQKQLAEKLHRTPSPLPHGTPEHASIQFDQHDAIRIRCDGDRVELILSIAELARGRDRIQDVEVHAFFRPVIEGMQVKLMRDGTLQFDGRRLLTAQRIVLHTVFGKLLPKDAEIPLLTPKIEGDERLAGLMITQLVIDDGWLAVAVGPRSQQRAAWRTRDSATR